MIEIESGDRNSYSLDRVSERKRERERFILDWLLLLHPSNPLQPQSLSSLQDPTSDIPYQRCQSKVRHSILGRPENRRGLVAEREGTSLNRIAQRFFFERNVNLNSMWIFCWVLESAHLCSSSSFNSKRLHDRNRPSILCTIHSLIPPTHLLSPSQRMMSNQFAPISPVSEKKSLTPLLYEYPPPYEPKSTWDIRNGSGLKEREPSHENLLQLLLLRWWDNRGFH